MKIKWNAQYIFLMVLENVFAAYPLFVILIIYILLNEHDNDDLTELLGIQWYNCQFMTNNQDISV
mgnify:CR=1 FL=1